MKIKINNLYKDKDLPHDQEYIKEIFSAEKSGKVFIEHIISFGNASPKGFWYDQKETEWVALLKGNATLLFEDKETVELSEGDYIIIPQHERHRVESVSNDAIWLAFFINSKNYE